jgi:LPS export ABC transporter protein LptC
VTFGLQNAGMTKTFLHKRTLLAAIIFGSCLFMQACENSEKEIQDWTSKKVMVEEAIRVQTLFSSGGKLKANLKAPLMLRYEIDTSYVEFPKTLHVDFYDSLEKKESNLDSRYGKYFETLGKVFLKDSVVVANIKGDTLKCPELWWDQNTKKFYTDKYVRLKTNDKQIYGGSGFEADQDLTRWSIYDTKGIIFYKDSAAF